MLCIGWEDFARRYGRFATALHMVSNLEGESIYIGHFYSHTQNTAEYPNNRLCFPYDWQALCKVHSCTCNIGKLVVQLHMLVHLLLNMVVVRSFRFGILKDYMYHHRTEYHQDSRVGIHPGRKLHYCTRL